jgi:hypothetical protein
MYWESAMTDDEVREWVKGRLTYEAWLRALHAARDAQAQSNDDLSLSPVTVATPASVAPGRVRATRGRGVIGWLHAVVDHVTAPHGRRALAR